jgi:hypothetical protein
MWVYLKNGCSFHFPDATEGETDTVLGYLNVNGRRKKEIATFRLDAIACWYFDHVKVTPHPAEGVRS